MPGDGPEIWLKDDGRFASGGGGNKARKLEWTLADALRRRRTTILTFGALGTNHGLATAHHAGRHGLRTVLLLVDQPADDHLRGQLERIEATGARIHRTRGTARTAIAAPWAMLRYAGLRPPRLPYVLSAGGSSPLGSLGYVEAALELAAQVEAGELPEPAHALVALGSGGTAAGLALGLRLAGLRTRVIAVLVSDVLPLSERSVARLARRSLRLLRRRGARPEGAEIRPGDLDVERRWLGAGYGHRTPEAEAARELLAAEGVGLDPVYTAKAMAAVLGLRAEGRLDAGPVLYWHTYGPPGSAVPGG